VRCFDCDAALDLASGERVGFRDTCNSCAADLHVCLNCRHHDPTAYNECRESSAERVADRARANRCDYFSPGAGSGPAEGDARTSARGALDDLFKKS
jgi:hypothetical protein